MRKAPQQQRSKIIVDHILEATQQCIAQYGLLHTTTPKIAEKSGVSVGRFTNTLRIKIKS